MGTTQRKSWPMIVTCKFIAAALLGSQAGGLVNGGFEEADATGRPKAWIFSDALTKAGYRIAVAEDGPAGGKRCGTLTAPVKPGQGMFGNLMQSLDATPWRGKRVRFKA